jgi:hypothetical protein
VYLVQRCTYRGQNKAVNKATVSDFYPQDYMGAAEFEFGALPASLRDMYAAREKYKIWKMGIKPKNILWAWGNEFFMDDINEQLDKYINTTNGGLLKERISLWDILNGKKSYRDDNFWWDIGENFVFSLIEEAVRKFPDCLKNSIELMDSRKAARK